MSFFDCVCTPIFLFSFFVSKVNATEGFLIPDTLHVQRIILDARSLPHLVPSLVSGGRKAIHEPPIHHIHDLDSLLWQLSRRLTLDRHISTILIILINEMGCPGPDKETLASLCTRRGIVRDLDRPAVIEIRTGVTVFANEVKGLATIITQRELAGPATMTRLVQLENTTAHTRPRWQPDQVFMGHGWAPETNLFFTYTKWTGEWKEKEKRWE